MHNYYQRMGPHECPARADPQPSGVPVHSQTELHNCQIRMDSLDTLDGHHYDMPRVVPQPRDAHFD